jgi:hypothetical protein
MQKEDLYYIQICSIYLDENSSIEKIKREKYFLKEVNTLPVHELKSILKREIYKDGESKKIYYPFCILKYNITEEDKNQDQNQKLVSLKRIETIQFEKSLPIFHELNELIIIYHKYEMKREVLINTKRTRKVYAFTPSSSYKKTIRKK